MATASRTNLFGEQLPPPKPRETPPHEEPWVRAIMEQMCAGFLPRPWKPKNCGDSFKAWAPILKKYLEPLSDAERARFVPWLFGGDGHWCDKPYMLKGVLAGQCEAFVNMGCPASKASANGKNGHKQGFWPKPLTHEELQAQAAAAPPQCGLCGRDAGQVHLPKCKSGLGGQPVLAAQDCVIE